MFLGGVGFEYKRNPQKSAVGTRTMGWRRQNQGLDINFTAKGRKEGKRNANFYVGIAHGKGVTMCVPIAGLINGEKYIEKVVPAIEEAVRDSIDKRIIQDNCRVMNSNAVVVELNGKGILRMKIPPRSPDINCIENVFHSIKLAIQKDAIRRGITTESFLQFQARAAKIIREYSTEYIDKVIDTMGNRVDSNE